jgi:hypothetical protein
VNPGLRDIEGIKWLERKGEGFHEKLSLCKNLPEAPRNFSWNEDAKSVLGENPRCGSLEAMRFVKVVVRIKIRSLN